MIFNFVDTAKLEYGSYVLPDWAQAIGWLVALVPIILIPVYSVIVVVYDMMCRPNTGESILQVIKEID